MTCFVGQLASQLSGPSPLAFLAFTGIFRMTALAQLLELAFFIHAPAHVNATSVAVYLAWFKLNIDATKLGAQISKSAHIIA